MRLQKWFVAACVLAGLIMSPEFTVGVSRVLFTIANVAGINSLLGPFGFGVRTPSWDLAPDGQRFLIHTIAASGDTSPIKVLLNWQALLEVKSLTEVAHKGQAILRWEA